MAAGRAVIFLYIVDCGRLEHALALALPCTQLHFIRPRLLAPLHCSRQFLVLALALAWTGRR